MTPCQSYLDQTTSYFGLTLNNVDPLWSGLGVYFPYNGFNFYAYLIANCDECYDLVQVMLYESWSKANYAINIERIPPAAYLEAWFRQMVFGWYVDFSDVGAYVDISTQWVRINASKLVVWLANGWAGVAPPPPNANLSKQIIFMPDDLNTAHAALVATGTSPRGYMFWDIVDEGRNVTATDGSTAPLWLAPALLEWHSTISSTCGPENWSGLPGRAEGSRREQGWS